ncbi:GTP cyclohydrolase [Rhizobium sp. P32RR-XVIII]|uniref:YciI family protein n=1 Tax=Rhizobium sp. P32RR-XVIII TaxID=2726738 RepID=UPI0014574D1C|nr:YciI family protein [Rhizobium sp. P32RR-XVIII]NLS05489.1 GTP cyclohydrolase [Rhizobium sp. P32RR-XVIII]
MFILSLIYVKPNEEADKHMEQHMAWVKAGYAKGWFLASGRKVPRTGGVILAIGDRAEIEAYVAADPFTVHGVANYDITEVAVTTVADGLDILKSSSIKAQ